MKPLSETSALSKLESIRNKFRSLIRDEYEHRARSCTTCDTPGACCLDAHFVNVRITRLEATAIRNALESLEPERREEVYSRIDGAIEKYGLDQTSDTSSENYSCPLFEREIGCLVHNTAKPLPCIAHACYERIEDLPPDELLTERENEIERLNRRVYGRSTLLPLPVAIKQI